jgi:hypothetical protein
MNGLTNSAGNSPIETSESMHAAPMDEGYFLVWIAMWIIAPALLLPTLT